MNSSETGNGELKEKAVRRNTNVILLIVIIVSLILTVGIPGIMIIFYKRRKKHEGNIYVYLKHKKITNDTRTTKYCYYLETLNLNRDNR